MGFLVRLFFFFLLLYFLYYLYRKVVGFLRLSSSSRPPPPITGQVHKDPQCGLYVAEELAVKTLARGQQFYFCSTECRDRFLEGG